MNATTETSVTKAFSVRAYRAFRWRYNRLRGRIVTRLVGDQLQPQIAAARVPMDAEIVVYFGEEPERLYQLEQWLPVLDDLAVRRRVLIVVRDIRTLYALDGLTTLPTVCVSSFLDLIGLYDLSEIKLGIYVNNGFRNFQSLNNRRMLHVHVNHGESDKRSSFSNQAKAYDRVFVAGPVAVERYREALMEFDENKLVLVGRPQLDLEFPPALAPTTRRTVLYAPTWEGDNASNNWTSLDTYGVSIVEQILAIPDVRLVYKPHPRVPASRHPGVAAAHAAIVPLIQAASAADPVAGHVVNVDGNILSMLASCDALVGDVSSVTLDYLYLRPEGPIFLTDRRNDRLGLMDDSPLSEGADIVDTASLTGFGALLADRLVDDARREDRARARKNYFGDLRPGESTQRFAAAVDELIALRDELVAGKRRLPSGLDDGELPGTLDEERSTGLVETD